jgi:hypothetical protein
MAVLTLSCFFCSVKKSVWKVNERRIIPKIDMIVVLVIRLGLTLYRLGEDGGF